MAAHSGRNNLVAGRVIDDLIDISRERSPLKYLKIFIEQQITDHRRFIARMRDEIRTSTNLISQLNALIAELEASGDYEEVFDLVMELRDDRRDEQDNVVDFNRLIVVVEEKIRGKEIDLEISLNGMECYVYGFIVHYFVVNGIMSGYEVVSNTIMETQAIDDQDPLVNYDNDNENDDLGYQLEEYFDEVQEDDENNHSNGNVVKMGITRISGKHRALFFSFLGDMVREHIGLNILSWKKVDSEARDKLWDKITLHVKSVAAKNGAFQVCLSAYNGTRWIRTCERENDRKKEIEPDEEPARGTLWLKGRINKDGEYPDDEIRSMGDKLDKIKEGTLKVDHGTDAITVVLVSPVDINPMNNSADEEGGTTVIGCENDASIQKSNGLETLEKDMETR
nr:hypothetical protein [Tanacetum cinerariifolium]